MFLYENAPTLSSPSTGEERVGGDFHASLCPIRVGQFVILYQLNNWGWLCADQDMQTSNQLL